MTRLVDDMPKILAAHAKWLGGDPDGSRANLRDADLSGANLRDANLPDFQIPQDGSLIVWKAV